MVEQVYLSPQVKQSAKRVAKRLETEDFRKLGNILKIWRLYRINIELLVSPPELKALSVLAKISRKIEVELFL